MSKSLSKSVKSVEKLMSGTNFKLCVCVLLVGMILFVLNRFKFTCSKEEFLNDFSAYRQQGLSNRAYNEYRRVKMKYGGGRSWKK
jgi:hypothetical protein